MTDLVSLSDRARAQPLTPAEVVRVVNRLAGQLDAGAVRGQPYGKVRPETIAIDEWGNAEFAGVGDRVSDTGLADQDVPERYLFSSPEQLRELPITAQSDQYSLGCTAFALLTGNPPYPGLSATATALAHAQDPIPSATARNAALPPAVDRVFARVLAKDPGRRFPDSSSFAAALDSAMRVVPSAAPLGQPAPARRTEGGRRRMALIIGIPLVVALVAAGISAFVMTRGSERSPDPGIISAGDYALCLARTGGPLGCGDPTGSGDATDLPNLNDVTAVATGVTQYGKTSRCAVSESYLYCWGDNSHHQTGLGEDAGRSVGTPTRVPDMGGTSAVAMNDEVTCAIRSGDVYCWGDGVLRDQDDDDLSGVTYTTPHKMPGISGATAISTGDQTTCAVVHDEAWCWGYNSHGAAGTDTASTGDRDFDGYLRRPVKVEGLGKVTAIATSGSISCAISDSKPYCWGELSWFDQESRTAGRVGGNGLMTENTPHPVPVPGFGKVSALALGSGSDGAFISPVLCAVVGRQVKCTGLNEEGQLGAGNTDPVSAPVTVKGVSGAREVAVGGHFACAMTSEDVLCWGLVPGISHGGPNLTPTEVGWPV